MNANGTKPACDGKAGRASLDETVSALGSDVRRALDSARRVLYVESRRLQLFAVEAYFKAAFYICLLGFGLTASISASLFVVRGVRSALGAWSGAQWVGELGAGVVVLGIVLGGGFAVRAHLVRSIVRQTRRKLEPKAGAPETAPRMRPQETGP